MEQGMEQGDLYLYEAKNVRLLKRAVNGIHDGTCGPCVELGGLNVRAGGACTLAVVLKASRAVTSLNLADNPIGDDGATALAGALRANTSLTALVLRANRVGDAGATALADALRRNATLRSLSLRSNELTEEGCAALAEALERNGALTALDLRKNFISGAHETLDAVKRRLALNRLGRLTRDLQLSGEGSLTALDLRGDALPPEQRLGDEGACALFRALRQNCRLVSLRLWSNGVGDEGACSLAALLRGNAASGDYSDGGDSSGRWAGAGATLTSIGLQDNAVGDAGAKALAAALSCRRAPGFSAACAKGGEDEGWTQEPPLLELRLWNNRITSDGAAALAACLRQRPIASAGDALPAAAGPDDAAAAAAAAATTGPDAHTAAKQGTAARGGPPPARPPGNATLRTLDLRSNRVGGAGVVPLLRALRSSCSLVTVALGGNVGVEKETASDSSLVAYAALAAQLAHNRVPLCRRLGSGDGGVPVLPDGTLRAVRLRPWQRRTVGVGLSRGARGVARSSSCGGGGGANAPSPYRRPAKGAVVPRLRRAQLPHGGTAGGSQAADAGGGSGGGVAAATQPGTITCGEALAALCHAARCNCTLRSLDLASWGVALEQEQCGSGHAVCNGDELARALARALGAPVGEGALRGLQRLNLSANGISWRAGAELVAALQQQQERVIEERDLRRFQQAEARRPASAEPEPVPPPSAAPSVGPVSPAAAATQGGVAGLPPLHPAVPARVSVWWPSEEEWFDGTAVAYRSGVAASGLHVLYDDGDEDFDLPWDGTRLKWLEQGWEKEEWSGAVSASVSAPPVARSAEVTKVTHPCCKCAHGSEGEIDPSDPGAGAGTGLRVLLLRGNSLGEDGARALLRLLRGDHGTGGDALPPYTSLTELDLRGNGVSDERMQEVAEALAWNRWTPLLRVLRGGTDEGANAATPTEATCGMEGALLCAAARLEAAGGSLCGIDAPARGFGGGKVTSASAAAVARGGFERNAVEPCCRVLCAPDCGVGDTLCAALTDALLDGLAASPPAPAAPPISSEDRGEQSLAGALIGARSAADIDALELPMNFIGDPGCTALAHLCLERERLSKAAAASADAAVEDDGSDGEKQVVGGSALAAAPAAAAERVLAVRRLVLHGNPDIGEVGVAALLEAVRGCPSLTSVDVRGASVGPPLLAAVTEAAAFNRLRPLLQRVRGARQADEAPLVALSLRGEGVGDGFMRELSNAIRSKRCALLRLDLGENPGIGDAGAAALAAAIAPSGKQRKPAAEEAAPPFPAAPGGGGSTQQGAERGEGEVAESEMSTAYAAAAAAADDASAAGTGTRTNRTLVSVAVDGTGVGAALRRLVLERCVANELKGVVAAVKRGEGGTLLDHAPGAAADDRGSTGGDAGADGRWGRGRHALGAPEMGASAELEEDADEIAGAEGEPPPPPPRRLALRGCKIGAELAAKLGAALRGNCAVRVCDLRGNAMLGDAGATALARSALRPPPAAAAGGGGGGGGRGRGGEGADARVWGPPPRGSWLTLRVLNLRASRVADAGAASLARALGASPLPHLTVLNLRGNLLTDTACAKFAKAFKPPKKAGDGAQGGECGGGFGGPEQLKTPTLLRVLNLRDNGGITDAGAAKLGKGLAMNESVTELKMRGCGVTDEAQGLIAQGLCVSLKQLLQWW
jgi:Ran GTPase-activating protein (RanGAP) involved in mRNA processing and transport